MEKYAVDIDKVLDDFEETEALKIDNSNKNTNAHVLEPSLYITYNEQSHCSANDVGCIYENALKLSECANSNEENDSSSDKGSVSQSLTKAEYSKHLECPDGCDLEDSSFVENCVEISENNSSEQICVSSKPSRFSVSEAPSGINAICDSCYSSNIKSNDNTEIFKFVNEGNYVNAVKPVLKTVPESHSVQDSTILFPPNSSCDKNECFQNYDNSYSDNISTPETNIAVNFQELEGIKWDLSVVNLKEPFVDEVDTTEETQFPSNAVSSSVSDDSEQNIDIHSEAHKPSSFIDKHIVISKLEAAASEADEPCSQNNSSKHTSNSAAQDNKEFRVHELELPHPEYIQPEHYSEDDDSGVSSEEGHNSPLFFFNNEMLNCDDSAHAVSNQDMDLPENFDRSCDIHDDFENRTSSNSSLKSSKEVTRCNENISELQHSEGLSESTVGSTSPNKFTGARPKLDCQISQNPVPNASNKETETEIENKSVKDIYASNSGIDNVQSKTEAVPEIYEPADCDNCDSPNVVPVYTSCNTKDETMNDIESTETELHNEAPANCFTVLPISSYANKECSNSSDLKNDISASRFTVLPVSSDTSKECALVSDLKNEVSTNRFTILPVSIDANKECSLVSDIKNEVSSNRFTVVQVSTDANQECSLLSDLKNEVSSNRFTILPVLSDANKECSLSSDLKNENFQQRLSRPTSLDLPSRHLAASQSTGENNITGINNVQSAPAVDLLSNENLADNSASEPFPRPQPKIGLVKPFWIPDAEAPNCMHCGVKFTVIKRRHHCRACGKVLCSRCCNLKAKLAYLNKEDRICHPCFEILSSASQNEDLTSTAADSQSSSSCGSSPNFSPSPQMPNSNFDDKNSWRPHPNNPDDYCSTIPPLQQIQLSGARPPPTVMVPIGNKPRREPKQVIFSDGIRPGGDLTDLTEPADVIPAYRRIGRKRVEKALSGEQFNTGVTSPSLTPPRSRQKRILVSDDEGPLPPVILYYDNDQSKDEKVDWIQLLEKMQDDDQKPVNFVLMKNMHLFVKLTKLDCCFGKECWCFTSHGLCAVAQDEVMVLLERLPGENTLPRGIIKLFTHIYDSAGKGSTFDDLSHIIFPEQILGSSDHRGFLFVRPTFQCLSKLIVPNTPFLVAILIHKWEVPWAKVFPLRLMLRLGAECRYYPCALVSIRHRKPVFFEIGQTIMSVLADLRNYQFTIPVIPGLVVHMEEKKTSVNIPRNRYEKVMKILNSNNVEHVLALGSNFSSEADSHLVCMQKEEGDYQTQAINIENTTRRVTGASFIVFSGALKSSSGLSAKFSIVEDGLLVQIPQETMVALHLALREMKDLTIECGQINAAEPEEVVIIQWTRDDKKFNLGVRSPIDYRSLEGVPSLRIHTSTDYAGDNYLIRWTEVFFLEVDENSSSCTIQHEFVDPCRLAETVAQSCCMALAPYLDQLAESELTKIGLRVTLDSERDRVEYDIGARGKPLPAVYMNALDCGLIPVILRLSSSAQSEPVSFELIFYILIK